MRRFGPHEHYPERRLEHLADTGERRRRGDRRRVNALRITSAACVVAFVAALGGMYVQLAEEIDRAKLADRESVLERRIVSCTVRGVLELSEARAKQRGELNDPVVLPNGTMTTTRELFSEVLSRLRNDCPPLVTPAAAPTERGEPIPGRFPRPRG